jgi:MoaA/NifB/PqqE/SkfB family radical SAM enzyme
LSDVDCVGLSLDGSTAQVHDGFRNKRGNFDRVFQLLGFLDRAGVPVIVRTVVAQSNFTDVVDIGERLLPFDNVMMWYLLEFSPVGTGYRNQQNYELERSLFDKVAQEATDRYAGRLEVHARTVEAKSGAYVLITPDGDVYGTSDPTVGGVYPRVGSMLRHHLSELAEAIKFRRERHEDRYYAIDTKRQALHAALSASVLELPLESSAERPADPG